MMPPTVQLDPINSPYPVPWNWVMAALSESKLPDADRTTTSHKVTSPAAAHKAAAHGVGTAPKVRHYRSQSLISPDGQYAAYSRIQVQRSHHFTQNRVASALFLEDLATGELHTITSSSPFTDNPFTSDGANQPGTIAMLIPVAWSADSDRVLAREFESVFGSDFASDFAVIWDRPSNQTYTIAPTHVQYSNAVLLGWSQCHPDQALFKAGMMGNENWPLYAVDVRGQTADARNDRPVTYGQIVNSVWAGPQVYAQ